MHTVLNEKQVSFCYMDQDWADKHNQKLLETHNLVWCEEDVQLVYQDLIPRMDVS
jgi:hypothetical protein